MSRASDALPHVLGRKLLVYAAALAVLEGAAAGVGLAEPAAPAASPSPTMLRLQELHEREAARKRQENAQWRKFSPFPSSPLDAAGDAYRASIGSPRCEFYWPGWKLRPDGTRVTKVRACRNDWVAVDCRSLKLSWGYQPGPNLWTRKASPVSWSEWSIPNLTLIDGSEDAAMVAALCDGLPEK
jgi:hypothetical protein